MSKLGHGRQTFDLAGEGRDNLRDLIVLLVLLQGRWTLTKVRQIVIAARLFKDGRALLVQITWREEPIRILIAAICLNVTVRIPWRGLLCV